MLLANQAINNNGGASAYLLRALVYTQAGKLEEAAADLKVAQANANPQVQWEMLLAEGQYLENTGKFEEAAERYRRMMTLKPGAHRARLLLAELYRRSGNSQQAILEYKAIINSKPSIGQAYIGASKAYLYEKQVDEAIGVLEEVSSRNTSYNDVLLELIALYNQKATDGDVAKLEQAAQAINVLRENGVETRSFFRLIGEFYYTAVQIARATGKVPQINYPGEQMRSVGDLARANEAAWREYLARDENADREWVINERIMTGRVWQLV
ncbi:MAG: tetratricopeptide repeat protein [Chloroflexi bacterium]|uniref:tetratricopeptide repeat protein n=1 Tax=Candidatus Flexifilum breve TaxID=3140694 RepID=UPI003134E77D|nr:tetratricopeptide repeat protein [Chloroflexota bacterium]